MPYLNAAQRLDRLPSSRFHRRIAVLIASGAFLDAFDLYLANDVLAAMVKEGFADLRACAMFVSVTFVGMVLGAVGAGQLGDRFGRRFAYQLNLLIFGLASLAAYCAPDMRMLIALRFIMGLGLGAELAVAAGTLAEFVPPKQRGKWVARVSLVINAALPVVSILGYAVIPRLGWRCMFLIAGMGALGVWALRRRMPESPRWLESVGRLSDADLTLRAIEREVEEEWGALAPSRAVPYPVAHRAPPPRATEVSLRTLFSRTMLGRTLTAAMTTIGINVGIYGFISWLPTFFMSAGYDIVQSFGFVLLMSFGAPAGSMIAYGVGDRFGRVRSIVGAALASIVLGCAYASLHSDIAIVTTGFALISTLYTITSLGLLGYVPELFPTALRLRGTGVANAFGRGASIAIPYMTLMLFQAYGLVGVLGFVCTTLALMCVAIVRLRLETGGRSLEEIESDSVENLVIRHPI